MTEYGMADPRWCFYADDVDAAAYALDMARMSAESAAMEYGFPLDDVQYRSRVVPLRCALTPSVCQVGWYVDTEPLS